MHIAWGDLSIGQIIVDIVIAALCFFAFPKISTLYPKISDFFARRSSSAARQEIKLIEQELENYEEDLEDIRRYFSRIMRLVAGLIIWGITVTLYSCATVMNYIIINTQTGRHPSMVLQAKPLWHLKESYFCQ